MTVLLSFGPAPCDVLWLHSSINTGPNGGVVWATANMVPALVDQAHRGPSVTLGHFPVDRTQ